MPPVTEVKAHRQVSGWQAATGALTAEQRQTVTHLVVPSRTDARLGNGLLLPNSKELAGIFRTARAKTSYCLSVHLYVTLWWFTIFVICLMYAL